MKVIGDKKIDGTVSAIASGQLPDGSAVVLNQDGTVSRVEDSSFREGTATAFASSHNISYIDSVYDPHNKRIVVAFLNLSVSFSGYGTVMVGEVNSTDLTITWGNQVTFVSNATINHSLCFDSNNNKIIICYRDNADGFVQPGKAIVGQVNPNDNTISFANPGVTFVSQVSDITCDFDSYNGKMAVFYQASGTAYLYARVGTVITSPSDTIQFGTEEEIEGAGTEEVTCVYNHGVQNSTYAFGVFFRESSTGLPKGRVCTISGTNISEGAKTNITNLVGNQIACAFDNVNEIIYVQHCATASSANMVSNTVILNGTQFVVNTTDTITSYGAGMAENDCCFIEHNCQFQYSAKTSNNNTIVYGALSTFPAVNYSSLPVVSGSQYGTSSYSGEDNSDHQSIVYDPENKCVISIYYVTSGTVGAKYKVIQPIGQMHGKRRMPSTNFTGNSTVSWMDCCYDSTNNRVVVAYADDSNNEGRAAVGQIVNGNEIVFGSPTAFQTITVDQINCVYVPGENRVVIVFRNSATGNVGMARVGTVTASSAGNDSIAFPQGLSTVRNVPFFYPSTTVDTHNNRIVFAYINGNNSRCEVKVGQISNDVVSTSTEVNPFSQDNCSYPCVSFGDTFNQVLVGVQNNTSGYFEFNVGTVLPGETAYENGISFPGSGASVDTNSAGMDNNNGRWIAYSPEHNKYLAVWTNAQGSNNLSVKLLTPNATNGIDVSSPNVVINAGYVALYPSVIFDKSTKKFVVIYDDKSTNPNGAKIKTGTVNTTLNTISFSGGVTDDFRYSDIQMVYQAIVHLDTEEVNVVINSNSGNNNQIDHFTWKTEGTNLTNRFIGISDGKYTNGQLARIKTTNSIATNVTTSGGIGVSQYVQGDGTLSNSVSNPVVLAGTALSATDLIVKG